MHGRPQPHGTGRKRARAVVTLPLHHLYFTVALPLHYRHRPSASASGSRRFHPSTRCPQRAGAGRAQRLAAGEAAGAATRTCMGRHGHGTLARMEVRK